MATQQQSRAAPAVSPTAAERRLSALLRALARLFFVAAIVYAIGPFIPDFSREAPFVGNSVVEASIVGLAFLYASGDVRRRRGLIGLLIATQALGVLAMVSMALFGDTDQHAGVAAVLWNAAGLKALITAVLAACWLAARGP